MAFLEAVAKHGLVLLREDVVSDLDDESGVSQGLVATAMRLVNAIPAVVAAPSGLVSAPDLAIRPGPGVFAERASTP